MKITIAVAGFDINLVPYLVTQQLLTSPSPQTARDSPSQCFRTHSTPHPKTLYTKIITSIYPTYLPVSPVVPYPRWSCLLIPSALYIGIVQDCKAVYLGRLLERRTLGPTSSGVYDQLREQKQANPISTSTDSIHFEPNANQSVPRHIKCDRLRRIDICRSASNDRNNVDGYLLHSIK